MSIVPSAPTYDALPNTSQGPAKSIRTAPSEIGKATGTTPPAGTASGARFSGAAPERDAAPSATEVAASAAEPCNNPRRVVAKFVMGSSFRLLACWSIHRLFGEAVAIIVRWHAQH